MGRKSFGSFSDKAAGAMSSDFFQQQDAARHRTAWLILWFLLAVVSIVLAMYLVAASIYQAAAAHDAWQGAWQGEGWRWFNPQLFATVSAVTLAVILLGSLYKLAELSAGGEVVALLLGGRPVNPQSQEPAERRLLNVVEEMALASGTPVPPVYVLEKERGINAFAAGHHPGDAVVAVSRGCLTYLTRDELQGVMGHEFSHILNGDMRLNLRLTGAVFGILMLAVIGYYLLRIVGSSSYDRSDRRSGGAEAALVVLAVGMIAIGAVGVFFGKLIKSAVSRQREFLADASAVQFTRYPGGIAGALKKIGGLAAGSRIEDAHAEEVSHMFFADALVGTFFNIFASHPPLAERIARLDPSFDGNFPPVAPLSEETVPAEAAAALAEPAEPVAAEGRPKKVSLDPGALLGRVGTLSAAHVAYAAAMTAALPPALVAAAREPYSVRALIYGLLLAGHEATRQQQQQLLGQRVDEPLLRQTQEVLAHLAPLPEESRTALLDMAMPALKRLSPDQYATFRENVEMLLQAEGKIDLFEYLVRTVLLKRLDIHFGLSKPAAPRYRAITPVIEPLVTVISTLAYAGQPTREAAQKAFDRGFAAIGRQDPMRSKDACTLRALDDALAELAQAAPKLKKTILAACVACIAADGQVTLREAELLRAVSAMLDCPVPPIALETALDSRSS